MTKKIFRLMFFTGLLVLSSFSAGCGLFGGGNKEKITSLQLQNENLRGQLERTERDLDEAQDDNQDLETELLAAKAASTRLQSSRTVAVTPSGSNPVITVSGSVLFKAGSADLTSAGKSKLDSVASDIRSRYPGHHLSVEGHTDSSPLVRTKAKWGTNVWLSVNRARAVADHLVSRGIAENLVSVRGWGAGKPTGRGPNQDRRVEIVILSR